MKDGGQAFPTQYDYLLSQRGMTLRDYFAAGALAAMVGVYTKEGHTPTDLAVSAYQYADAMLRAREE